MANIVDKFTVKYWADTNTYYASVRFPDGSSQELKSTDDLTFAGWQTKISAAWDAIQNPPKPPEPVTLDGATKEELAAEVKERGYTAADLGLSTGAVK